MRPVVLLVYANPARGAAWVPPYGMERVAQAFEDAGCETRLEAPFMEDDPLEDLLEALGPPPDLVGFSIRNIDDGLVVRSEEGAADIDTAFYLDDVRPLVHAAVRAVGERRVLLGGTGFSSAPEALLHWLGASRGIVGPAEDLCSELGRSLAAGDGPVLPIDPRVVDLSAAGTLPRPRQFASAWHPPTGPTPRMTSYLRLALARGGSVPVQLSGGCNRRCAFCVEARFSGYAVVPRPVDEIVAEIEALQRLGVNSIWLTASELNVPTDRHAVAVLRALAGRGLRLGGFLQAAPVTDVLLDAMEEAGLDPEQVVFEFGHLDDRVLRTGGGPTNRRSIDRLVETWRRRGYGTLGGSVLFGGNPSEGDDTLQAALGAVREIDDAFANGLRLFYACGARVYPQTALADWVRAHPVEAAPHLYGADDPGFVRPVVFCRPARPRALLGHVRAALAGARGPMLTMNELAPDGNHLEAETQVTRGFWRQYHQRHPEAEACFRRALELVPEHSTAELQLRMIEARQAVTGP